MVKKLLLNIEEIETWIDKTSNNDNDFDADVSDGQDHHTGVKFDAAATFFTIFFRFHFGSQESRLTV